MTNPIKTLVGRPLFSNNQERGVVDLPKMVGFGVDHLCPLLTGERELDFSRKPLAKSFIEQTARFGENLINIARGTPLQRLGSNAGVLIGLKTGPLFFSGIDVFAKNTNLAVFALGGLLLGLACSTTGALVLLQSAMHITRSGIKNTERYNPISVLYAKNLILKYVETPDSRKQESILSRLKINFHSIASDLAVEMLNHTSNPKEVDQYEKLLWGMALHELNKSSTKLSHWVDSVLCKIDSQKVKENLLNRFLKFNTGIAGNRNRQPHPTDKWAPPEFLDQIISAIK